MHACVKYLLENTFVLVYNLFVCEPKYFEASCVQHIIPAAVVQFLRIVHIAVNFNNDFPVETAKVDNIATDWMLSSEPETSQLFFCDFFPQHTFSGGHFQTQPS